MESKQNESMIAGFDLKVDGRVELGESIADNKRPVLGLSDLHPAEPVLDRTRRKFSPCLGCSAPVLPASLEIHRERMLTELGSTTDPRTSTSSSDTRSCSELRT